ncbi:MAG TPA: DHA2 family efflux MFS transporter permease subunit [Pseudonocardiaceae bacterium]
MTVGGTRRKWWALGALAVSLLTVGLDATVLSVALPTIATDLHASTGDLQWFNDAYLLVLAAAMLPAGVLGDRFGRKRLLLAALAAFGAASALCAYATTVGELVAARALLGLGAAFMMPLSMAVLPVLFTDEERPRAINVWVAATAIGLPLGPIVGGWLLDNFWWGSVFLINVPLIAAALVAVSVLLPESRSSQRVRLDPVGALVSSAGLGAFTYGVIAAGERGWTDGGALATMIAGLVLLTGFVLGQLAAGRRGRQTLVDLTLFRSRRFTMGAVLATVATFAMFGLLFAVPQYLQAVGGAGPLDTGLRLLPIIGGLLVGARIGDRLTARRGAMASVLLGFTLMAAGLAVGAGTEIGTGYGVTAAWIALCGTGLGFAMPAAMDTAMGVLTAERSGSGSAVLMVLRQAAGAVGVAVLGSVLGAGYRGNLDVDGLPAPVAGAVLDSAAAGVAVAQRIGSSPLLGAVRAAFVEGMDAMLLVSVGVAALGALLALALPRPGAAGHAERPESERDIVAIR